VGTTPKTASKAAVFCRLPTDRPLLWVKLFVEKLICHAQATTQWGEPARQQAEWWVLATAHVLYAHAPPLHTLRRTYLLCTYVLREISFRLWHSRIIRAFFYTKLAPGIFLHGNFILDASSLETSVWEGIGSWELYLRNFGLIETDRDERDSWELLSRPHLKNAMVHSRNCSREP
jgi:hypothetical protein